MRYWVNTVSRDHVRLGARGGFTQAGHGRSTRLSKLVKGDALVFYSGVVPRPVETGWRSFIRLRGPLGAVNGLGVELRIVVA
jgi:hypothetical protein